MCGGGGGACSHAHTMGTTRLSVIIFTLAFLTTTAAQCATDGGLELDPNSADCQKTCTDSFGNFWLCYNLALAFDYDVIDGFDCLDTCASCCYVHLPPPSPAPPPVPPSPSSPSPPSLPQSPSHPPSPPASPPTSDMSTGLVVLFVILGVAALVGLGAALYFIMNRSAVKKQGYGTPASTAVPTRPFITAVLNREGMP